jgi:RHS repeat-associated protein
VLGIYHTHNAWLANTNNEAYENIGCAYDLAGRLAVKSYFFQDVAPKNVITNTYNTLGQLITKQIGDGTYLMQTMDYKYNIRGWLTKINNPAQMQQDGDLFAMELLYNNVDGDLTNTARYNGNISAIKWQTAQPTGVTTPVTTGLKAYCYTYDNLNRLLNGTYSEVLNGSWVNNNKYSEKIINSYNSNLSNNSYDLNGNIQGILRNGLVYPTNAIGNIDNLMYSYEGNKLVGVDDMVFTPNVGDFTDNGQYYFIFHIPEYEYDANGNLTMDKNKGILNITYNTLNLPSSIDKTGGYRIAYVYDAAGNKLQQLYYENGNLVKTTDFIGNFVYENDMPSCIVYDEGRVVYANNSRNYFGEVYLKDHLGNVRVACRRENGVLKTRQVDNYYPFGMNIKGLTLNSTDVNRPNEYLYNGKQMQDEMGLGWLDYGARFYDGVLGRFHTPDRYAEKYLSLTNYQYGANNPIRFIDVNGDSVVYKNPSTEQYVKQFTSKTVTNKKGKEVENKQYSELFAKTIEKLHASSTVYEFSDSYSSSDKSEEGAVTTDGKKVFVAFGEPDEGYGSRSNLLFEETYHALQVETGSMKIVKNSTGTGYGFSGDALNAEYGAKSLSTSAPGSSLSYKNANGLKIETQIGLIKRLDPQEGKRYLTDGYSKIYPGDNNATYSTDYLAPYPHLKK